MTVVASPWNSLMTPPSCSVFALCVPRASGAPGGHAHIRESTSHNDGASRAGLADFRGARWPGGRSTCLVACLVALRRLMCPGAGRSDSERRRPSGRNRPELRRRLRRHVPRIQRGRVPRRCPPAGQPGWLAAADPGPVLGALGSPRGLRQLCSVRKARLPGRWRRRGVGTELALSSGHRRRGAPVPPLPRRPAVIRPLAVGWLAPRPCGRDFPRRRHVRAGPDAQRAASVESVRDTRLA